MVPPVEDDEVMDQPVDMPDPVAHLRALVRRLRAQRRVGKGHVEILADRAALMQWLSVMDQGRDHAERIDLQIFRRMMLHLRPVDPVALVAEALFLKAEPHPARGTRSPAVVKDHHARLPKTAIAVFCLIYRELRAGSMLGSIAAMPWPDVRRAAGEVLLHEVSVEGMLGRLAEERGLFGCGFQQLFVLGVDVAAELDGLVPGHP